MFNNTEFDLGEVKLGNKYEVIFEWTDGELKYPKNILSGKPFITESCSCTKTEIEGNVVKVIYKPKPIPDYLLKMGIKEIARENEVVLTHLIGVERKQTVFKIKSKIKY